MTGQLEMAHLKDWIGREERAEDVVTQSLVDRFYATLAREGEIVEASPLAPRLIHFCLCLPAVALEGLGEDGHPAKGGFLPPVPLPRRMWASSAIHFDGDLRIGDQVERHSRIADIAEKRGRMGSLCFVTVEHQFSVDGTLRIEDRQTLVYREAQAASPPVEEPAPLGDTVASVDATPSLLFRYSALTFNSHRIHYDLPYASKVEGYEGLVVQGPLQASLLFRLARQIGGSQPDDFRFRGLSPLYDGDDVLLNAGALLGGKLPLWTAAAGGPIAMQAQASWL